MNRGGRFSQDDLNLLLTELIQQISKDAAIALKEGIIKPHSRSYMRFLADGSAVRGEELHKPDWAMAAFEISHGIERLPLYDEVVGRLSRFYGVEDKMARLWLSRFVVRVAEEALEGQKDLTLRDNIRVFSDEVENPQHAYEFNIRVHVEGLSLEDADIQLDDDTTLRNTSSQSHEVEVGFGLGKCYSHLPSAFLDIKAVSRSPPGVSGNEVETAVEIGMATLRLFKIGVVHYTRYDWHTKAILGLRRGSIIPTTSYVENPRYVIGKHDVDALRRFWLEVRKRLPKEVERYWSAERASALTLAFQRYSDALLRDGVFERRIATGVMGLEALYLSGGTESSYKLRVRAAKVLGFLGYNSTEVFENLKKGYAIRSAFVHGRLVKEEGRAKLSLLMTEVLEFLRASILVILLGACTDKDHMIELADSALICEDANNELKSRMEKLASLIRVPEGRNR